MSETDDIQARLEQQRSQAEKEQAEPSEHKKREDRDKIDAQRKKEISGFRSASDCAGTFSACLEKAGYVLAAGDSGYCVVSKDGVFNLRRHVDLDKVRFEAFLSAIPLERLPTVTNVLERGSAKTTAPLGETYDDPKLASLMQALAERQKEDARKLSDRHAFQLRQEEWRQDSVIADRIIAYRAAEEKRRESFIQRGTQDRTGIKAVIDSVRNWANPTLSAEKQQARDKKQQQFNRYLAIERRKFETQLCEEKIRQMAALVEKQRPDLIALHIKGDMEKERYKREHREACRIAAELDAQRRREELEKKPGLGESFQPRR